MTREEAIKFLSNTKVYVKDKSREIQKKLFEIGFTWDSYSNQEAKYEDKPFIFIYYDRRLTHSSDVNWFYNHQNKEVAAEDILNITIDELKYRPFKDTEECWNEMLKHEPFGWVKRKDKNEWFTPMILENLSDLQRMSDNYTFADGTPFGIKED